ncbi:MAG: hypothetical protein V4539_13045 [Bacteroidota bacterium]
MAKVSKTGLSGAIGPVVFYTMDGKAYARSTPGKQSAKHKKKLQPHRDLFGMTSSLSSKIADALRTELNCPFGRHSYNALRSWVFGLYKKNPDQTNLALHINPSALCELNPAAGLAQSFTAGISVTDKGGGMLSVSISSFNPAKDIKAPAGATWINLKLICASPVYEPKSLSHFELTVVQNSFAILDQKLPDVEMELHTHATKRALVCLALALEFRTGEHSNAIINIPSFLPAAVIALGNLE